MCRALRYAPQWTKDALAPYLEPLAATAAEKSTGDPSAAAKAVAKAVSALLLKYTRAITATAASQGTDGGGAPETVFCAR